MIWRALESSINQTYQNIEIIVGDNASTDNTREVVMKYVSKDPRIKYFRNEKNVGSGNNFLKCFENSSGHFLQALGSDDWLSRNYVEKGVETFLSNPDAGSVITEIISLALDKKTGKFGFLDDLPIKPGRYLTDWFFRGIYLGGASTGFISFLRREDMVLSMKKILTDPVNWLERGGGRREPMDMPAFLEIISKYKYIVVTKEPAYIKTVHGVEQVGSQGDFQSAGGHVRYATAVRRAYEVFFTNHGLKKHFNRLRFFGGLSIVVNIPLVVMRVRASKKERSDYLSALKSFFESYSISERLLIILGIIPYIFWRVVKRISESFVRRSVLIPTSNYFLTSEFEFKA